MIKALLYEHKDRGTVTCNLCPHYCNIQTGKSGLCRVRKNIDGKLFSLNSDKIVVANTDPIEKKPLFHFLPASSVFSIASSGCNFHCDFCQNHSISILKNESDITGETIVPEELVEAALNQNCNSIAYTYTEPTVFFELMIETARLAKEKGIKNVIVTNGFISPQALNMLIPLIDAANIDIKAFSDDFYKKYCGGRLEPVLDTIRAMKKSEIWLELTTLLIPKLNTDRKELDKLTDFILDISSDTPWHISRFFPNYKISDIEPTDTELIEDVLGNAGKKGLKYLYGGNFISDWESTFCPSCGAELIKRKGYSVSIQNLSKGKCNKCGKEIPGVWK